MIVVIVVVVVTVVDVVHDLRVVVGVVTIPATDKFVT